MLGATAGIGGAIGLPLGGLLVDQASYHWIFWISAAMGVIATITTIRFVPESPLRSPGKVDYVGAGILAVGLSAVLIAVSRANDWGWTSDKTLGLVADRPARPGRVRGLRAPPRGAAGQHAHAQPAGGPDHRRRHAAGRLRPVRHVRADPAARGAAHGRRRRPRPQRHPGRPADGAGRADDADRRADRRPRQRARRLQAAARRRLRARRRRPAPGWRSRTTRRC